MSTKLSLKCVNQNIAGYWEIHLEHLKLNYTCYIGRINNNTYYYTQVLNICLLYLHAYHKFSPLYLFILKKRFCNMLQISRKRFYSPYLNNPYDICYPKLSFDATGFLNTYPEVSCQLFINNHILPGHIQRNGHQVTL